MLKGKTILLIDDDPDMREIGKRIIRRAGYNYISASSGQEGLARILEQKPDLIILDLMMPEMNGDEVFKEFITSSKYAQSKDTPVIMLTAKNDEYFDQSPLFEMGLSAWLVKPFGHRELINVIENVFILHDVRQRNRQLEQEIRKTEYKYHDLLENVGDVIFTLDRQGNFVFINNQLRALTGHPRKQWIGKSLFDLVEEEDRSVAREAIQECMSGKAQTFEMRMPCKDGRVLYFSTNMSPLFEDGTIVGSTCIARDITDRKFLEEEILDLKNFYESIIQSLGSGLITVDLERRITFFNSGAEAILGYSSQEVLGRYLDEIFPAEESKQLLPVLPSSDPFATNREMEISTKEGKKVYIGYTTIPRLDNLNRKVGTIISFRDISEFKRMQAEVIRMDRLASLGVLASGIAHEIRNPLAGIKTMAQTLEEEIAADDPKAEYLARIIRQVNRLDELLRAFFSYARPRHPIRKYHQLPDIVHEVTILLKKKLKSLKVTLKEDYGSGLLSVFVDLNQIQQVIFNLILNALDAMPEGGELSIRARVVKTRLRAVDRRKGGFQRSNKQATFVELKITDTGMGIKPEHLETIFDPFFTTKSHGAGLGLSIVYRIMEEHGGEVRVESEWGKGSTFTLLLPTGE